MKVAIVHDWLIGGGAELVVEELHRLFPDAPIYTSYCTEEWRERLDDRVITGYLQNWPFSRLRKALPVLRQRWFKKLNLADFDLVISSSGNGEAKFVQVKKPAIHVCYCHSPTHFYWRHFDYYKKVPGFGPQFIVRVALSLLVGPMRKRDYRAAQAVDFFIANSEHIKADIKKFYNRDSVVIHPPVNVEAFSHNTVGVRRGFVTVGRQVPYKRVDIIVDACTRLNLPLKVLGSGPEHDKLVKRAGPNVEFVSPAPFSEVVSSLQNSKAFILAAFEDFGITPVEAMAAGTPVIAYGQGGALDYVDKDTGLLFKEQSVESLVEALKTFESKVFDPKKITKRASNFSSTVFKRKIAEFIDNLE